MSAENPSPQSIITRKEFMERNSRLTPGGDASTRHQNHRDYYAQFVTDETLRFVADAFSADTLTRIAAEDPVHLNHPDIPIEDWYRVTTGVEQPDFANKLGRPLVRLDRAAWKQAHGRMAFSPSDMICVAKEAARMLQLPEQ